MTESVNYLVLSIPQDFSGLLHQLLLHFSLFQHCIILQIFIPYTGLASNSFLICNCLSIIVVIANSTTDAQFYLQTYVLLSVMSVINVMLMLLLVSTICIKNDLKVVSFVRTRQQHQKNQEGIYEQLHHKVSATSTSIRE